MSCLSFVLNTLDIKRGYHLKLGILQVILCNFEKIIINAAYDKEQRFFLFHIFHRNLQQEIIDFIKNKKIR